MTVEPPRRELLPRHVVVAWMASWYSATGRDDWAAGYIGELMTHCAGDGAKQGES
jgi:hypothetical protein